MRDMTPAEQVRFDAMIAQHRRVRTRLPAAYQQDLGRLTVEVRKQLFAKLPRGTLLASATQTVSDLIPALTAREAASLAEYALGGIAAGDTIGGAVGHTSRATPTNATESVTDTQARFNIHYLQLQNQMQLENRQYTMVTSTMRAKQNAVKNGIANVR
jgi:hypothetical protein